MDQVIQEADIFSFWQAAFVPLNHLHEFNRYDRVFVLRSKVLTANYRAVQCLPVVDQ